MSLKFTICVLLYGDYPLLADRCLGSLWRTLRTSDLSCVRIGLNAVSNATRLVLAKYVTNQQVFDSSENIHKYPMMRRMLHEATIESPYTMWFDDDSYLRGYELVRMTSRGRPYWLDRAEHAIQAADMIGALYTQRWQGQQREWVKAQPWYAGNDPASRENVKFATGGWWTIRTEILYRFNYPFHGLDHCGGDTMLGELCLQQRLRLKQFRDGVVINADEHGSESKAVRRGFTEKPLGFYGATPVAPVTGCPLRRLAVIDL